MLYGAYFFAKQPLLIYAKKTLLISFLSIVNVAGNIALIPIFVKYWGVYGAAWATLLAGVIYVLVTFLLSQKYYAIIWEYTKIMSIYYAFLWSISNYHITKEYNRYIYCEVNGKVITNRSLFFDWSTIQNIENRTLSTACKKRTFFTTQ
jgi:O-antigen/teichoic acid export membrane protein